MQEDLPNDAPADELPPPASDGEQGEFEMAPGDLDGLPPDDLDVLPPMSAVATSGLKHHMVEAYPMTRRAIAKCGATPLSAAELKELYIIKSPSPESFMEVFCPPRICPAFRRLGLTATVSADIETGWDLSQNSHRSFLMELVHGRQPHVVLLSPPCLPFSQMQRSNKHRADPILAAAKMAEGREFLEFSMQIARVQITNRRLFVYEHPATASSWAEDCVVGVAAERCSGG